MLPVVVSIPHGGTSVPPEVRDRVNLSAADLFDDIDPCTREIYDLGSAVAASMSADVARTFVDLNRAPDDRPPQNPDGVVKTTTCFGVPIYHPGCELTDDETDRLIATYHAPYHRALEQAARRPDVVIGLDCHSMLAEPPRIAPDHSTPRPLFCLSNANGTTCPDRLLDVMAAALAEAYACDPSQVTRNEPFRGGYIVRRHGLPTGSIPWMQVEMNRSWYLADPWFDRTTLTVDPDRLTDLRGRFHNALHRFAARL